MLKAVTIGVWLLLTALLLSIGNSSNRSAPLPQQSNHAAALGDARLELALIEDEPGIQYGVDPFLESTVLPGETEVPGHRPEPCLSRRQAIIRMYECLVEVDPGLELTLGEFAKLEDHLILEEENWRQVWALPLTDPIHMAVDAESGALLRLFRPSRHFEAPRIVSMSQAEGMARKFLATAYPEFRSRPFRFDEAVNQGNSWLICFEEYHGGDVAQFRNRMSVEVDAANGGIVTYRATYVRVETDPIRISADAAKSRAMDYLFPPGEPRPAQFSKIEIQACIEPVTRTRATAHWNVVFNWPVAEGEVTINYARGADVDGTTGEIIVRQSIGKMD